jgi:putative ABC transport system ATP-binding protein
MEIGHRSGRRRRREPAGQADAAVAIVEPTGEAIGDRPSDGVAASIPAAEIQADPIPPPSAEQTAPLVVSLRDVSRRYSGAATVVALEGASLDVRAGEFVVVLGPSGSGKTTLLNLIGALDVPSSGTIWAAGHELAGAKPGLLARYRRESVSFIFQTFNLFPGLTALENVQFGADVAKRSSPRDAALEMLNRVGLGDRVHHFPHALSGGEQQRVAIARALATGNPLILADEPTGELDFRTGIAILELLRAQAATGRAVLVVTHNREIARVADRVVELSSGRIVADHAVVDRTPIGDLHW